MIPHSSRLEPADIRELLKLLEKVQLELVHDDMGFWDEWDRYCQGYKILLKEAGIVVAQVLEHTQRFHTSVGEPLRAGNSNLQESKNIIFEFVEKGLCDTTQHIPQELAQLHHGIQFFPSRYSAYVIEQYKYYETRLKELHENKLKVQVQLDRYKREYQYMPPVWARICFAFLLSSRIPGTIITVVFFVIIGRVFESVTNHDNARIGLLGQFQSAEMDITKVAEKLGIFMKLFNTSATLAHNAEAVAFLSNRLIQTWSKAHSDLLAANELLSAVDNVATQAAMRRRINLASELYSSSYFNIHTYNGVFVLDDSAIRGHQIPTCRLDCCLSQNPLGMNNPANAGTALSPSADSLRVC